MIRQLSVAILALTLSFPGHLPATETAAISHHIVGKWQFTHSADACVETHDYRPDGSLLIASGKHESAASYTISQRQNAQGYYELSVQPRTFNDATRCAGNPLAGGSAPYVAYVIFHRTQPLHLLCETSGLEKCLGPLRRVHEP
jgi:hypothetical protein